METVLLVVQLMLAVALVTVILFQRTAQDGGGLVGGGSTMGGLFTARGSANLLTRTTAILATLFILNSLALGYIASSQHQTRSIVDQINPQAPNTPPVTGTAVPAALPASNAPTPIMPPATGQKPTAAPAAPQVPLGQ
jgi:preprotein translocase subunit SecG